MYFSFLQYMCMEFMLLTTPLKVSVTFNLSISLINFEILHSIRFFCIFLNGIVISDIPKHAPLCHHNYLSFFLEHNTTTYMITIIIIN